MTEPDIAAIRERLRERHREAMNHDEMPGLSYGICVTDGKPWPCDAAQLLALLADTPSVEPGGQCDGYAGDPGASAPRCESYAGHPGRHFIRPFRGGM